eukprot:3057326-Pyramimonas_sp.AAC.1
MTRCIVFDPPVVVTSSVAHAFLNGRFRALRTRDFSLLMRHGLDLHFERMPARSTLRSGGNTCVV